MEDFTENNERLLDVLGWTEAQTLLFFNFIEELPTSPLLQ